MWHTSLNLTNLLVEAISLTTACEIWTRVRDLIIFYGSKSLVYQKRMNCVELSAAHAMVASLKYQEARSLLKGYDGLVRRVENERQSSGVSTAFEQQYSEATALLESIKSLRGPTPERKPVPSRNMKGWWCFDASLGDDVTNACGCDEQPSINIWKAHSYPEIQQLCLQTDGLEGCVELDGLADVFPCLKMLVIEHTSATAISLISAS